MEITFWGVRGSIPVAGKHTQRWGGNSSCLQISHPGCKPLLLDAGTGAREASTALLRDPSREVHVLLTHLHMDHVFGLPFFVPIYVPGYSVQITVPAYSKDEAREKVARFLNGTYHPTRLRDLPATVCFSGVRPGRSFERGGYSVQALALNHPGGSLGYRLEVDGQVLCYITDTAPFAKPDEGAMVEGVSPPAEQKMIDFLRGADVVVYDTMYSREVFLERMIWGHSYPEYAHKLCSLAGVKHLVLFHHDPDANDDALDRLSARWANASSPTVSLAKEGVVIGVEG